MAKSRLDMDGPFDLTRKEVERIVLEARAGNFAVGHISSSKKFVVRSVGRGDTDVRDALLRHAAGKNGSKPGLLGRMFGNGDTGPTKFKFSYAADANAAYAKECRNYHDFGASEKLRNTAHPKPPAGNPGPCQICGR
jgi:hypothetical protein